MSESVVDYYQDFQKEREKERKKEEENKIELIAGLQHSVLQHSVVDFEAKLQFP